MPRLTSNVALGSALLSFAPIPSTADSLCHAKRLFVSIAPFEARANSSRSVARTLCQGHPATFSTASGRTRTSSSSFLRQREPLKSHLRSRRMVIWETTRR